MKQLETSLPRLTGLSSESDNSTNQRRAQYAAERARLLFGQYRKGDANDPETYTASIAAILSDYPEETIRYVTDPRTGLAANPMPDPETGRVWTGMPNPGEVKRACENHDRPRRNAIAREAQERKRIAEMAEMERIAQDRPNRLTYDELKAKYGPNWGLGDVEQKPGETLDDFLKRHSITREQWDAIPDAKPSPIGRFET